MTPTPYDLLRARINELLPERLDAKLGCQVRTLDGISTIIKNVGKDFSYKTLVTDKGGIWEASNLQLLDDYEILGPELTITDVLRAVRDVGLAATISSNGRMEANRGDSPLCTFNLSLSLSAPENEAACEAVLSIITETV